MDSCCQSKREVSDGTPIPVGASEMTFCLQGMDCSEEVAAVERALNPISGVLGVRANLVAPSVTVYHDGSAQSAKLIEAINKSGVRVQMDETQSDGG